MLKRSQIHFFHQIARRILSCPLYAIYFGLWKKNQYGYILSNISVESYNVCQTNQLHPLSTIFVYSYQPQWTKSSKPHQESQCFSGTKITLHGHDSSLCTNHEGLFTCDKTPLTKLCAGNLPINIDSNASNKHVISYGASLRMLLYVFGILLHMLF